MKLKVIIIVILTVCAAAALRDLTAETPPIERLLDTPKSFPANSIGGMREVTPPSADLAGICQGGRVNVFTFYSNSCPGSRKLCAFVRGFTNIRPDVAFQMVNLGDQSRGSDFEALYGIKVQSVPHIMIYDTEGTLLAGDDRQSKAGLELLCDWINKEVAARSPRPST